MRAKGRVARAHSITSLSYRIFAHICSPITVCYDSIILNTLIRGGGAA